jgi:hypothetical protein
MKSDPVWIAVCAVLIVAACSPTQVGPTADEPDATVGASRAPSRPSGLPPEPDASSPRASDTSSVPAPDASSPSAPDTSSSLARDASLPLPADALLPVTIPLDAAPPRIVRVHDITASGVIAGLVYAHRVDTKTGTAGTRGAPLSDPELAKEFGTQNVSAAQLVADVLYAHDIHAEHVDFAETHAATVKIDKPDP